MLASALPALAVTFTSDTTISSTNSDYEGADVVITNCAVTIDGPHSFSGLHVLGGGVLSHSFFPNGAVSNLLSVSNEFYLVSSTNAVTLLNSNIIAGSILVNDTSGTILYTNGADYFLSSTDGIFTQLQLTTNSAIAEGTNVLVTYTSVLGVVPSGLSLIVTGDFEVALGGSINASGRGYGGGLGSGAGHSAGNPLGGSGGGYGGVGGMNSSNAVGGSAYGSFSPPSSLGSGGGNSYAGSGAPGGGLIKITGISNAIVNGTITANGFNATNSRAGGGSGGSVWLGAHAISGSGTITANGGNGEPNKGGGGGGGRIGLYYDIGSFGGSLASFGGTGAKAGGAGTIYTLPTGQHGALLVDNNGQAGTNTPLSLTSSLVDLSVRGGAIVSPSAGLTLGNITVYSNALIAANPLSSITLGISGNLSVLRGGAVTADGAGYGGGTGTGVGRNYNDNLYIPCGGGGYGGFGGLSTRSNAVGGTTYGSQTEPGDYGSGGGQLLPYSLGGNGGGIIRLTVSGIAQIEGRVSANGNNGAGSGGGGGAGGSVAIIGGSFLGSGDITANGGNGVDGIGGGGGGGRIEIAPTANLFAGNISAYGGGGANWGGAGTMYFTPSGGKSTAQLVLDNGGHVGTNTSLTAASIADLIVRGGAIGSASSSASFTSLSLYSNAWIAPAPGASYPAAQINLTFSGNATIQPGAGIIADFSGFVAGQGSGAGRYYQTGSTNYGSGAGHGGYGGNSAGNYATGGYTYDTLTAPTQAGSGGGGPSGSASLGGAGGGIIKLTVTGLLQVDGTISANGAAGLGLGGGGGSGGSVWLAVGTLGGSGTIAANGGNSGDNLGGGGAGGMIYIPCGNNSFGGSITAFGGLGANAGGAGTTFVQISGRNSQLTVDNGGRVGSATPLSSSSTLIDVFLRNGTLASIASSLSLGNLQINSNAWLVISNSPSLTFSSVTIQAGGGITADSTGYAPGQGIGAGRNYYYANSYPCSGGGHGGYGGNSVSNLATGGNAYSDTPAAPSAAGSGGGSYSPYSFGGYGGGYVHISVSGPLQNQGLITANGGDGSGLGGGGGSGGTIWLSVASLAGSGAITANGGRGADSIGGGGAGGAIAILFTSGGGTTIFSGTLSAFGGGGANWGGAGTIYVQPYGGPSQLTLDNGGHLGAATPIVSMSSATDISLRNGVLAFQQYPPQTFGNLLVASNGWLIANPIAGNNYPGIVNLTLTGNATLQSGGGIVTDSAGSNPGAGTGAGRNTSTGPTYACSGAGYGGYGAMGGGLAGGATYGSTASPTVNGSGGGSYQGYSPGGAGGGSIRLSVNGTLSVAGVISANGGNGSGFGGGGGSGGSVWLTPVTLAGSGSITANGGRGADGNGGGGGGGRISIAYNNNSFAGPISAVGGGGASWGGAGTVYLKANSQTYGQLTIDNGGHSGTNTTFDVSTMDLAVSGNGVAQWPSSSWTMHNIQIRTNSSIVTATSSSSQVVNVTGNATIDAGGLLSADGTGYGGGAGTGVGASTFGGGGGHGGYGGGNPPGSGNAYGSLTSPTTAGSGGGNGTYPYSGASGGAGGGALRLSITGTLALDGRISAGGRNGATGNAGGGAGGSVYITTSGFAGSGSIAANGGASSSAGGGAGGRVSLSYSQNNFLGLVTAAGGAGLFAGGAGTIYTKVSSQSIGQVLVDNAGLSGTNTPFSTSFGLPSQPFNLTLGNGAIVSPVTDFPVLSNLTVSAGGLLASVAGSALDLLVLNNAIVQPGGAIVVDAKGFAATAGPGHGLSNGGYGSGAGYGGAGGSSVYTTGGLAYGSAAQPLDLGSGGGAGTGPLSGGSEGGGALRLNVGGLLSVDGKVTANGNAALQDNAGGGSGGSIWINAGTLAGGGLLAADGGMGDFYFGGGGAGGRISLCSRSSIFFGNSSVAGADGYARGANGTIYISNNVAPLQVVAYSPIGVVSNGVSSIDLYFNNAPAPGAVSTSAFSLTSPIGPVPSGQMGVSYVSPEHYRVNLPMQTAVGDYAFTVNTNINDLYGRPMAQSFTGGFTISLPVIQGFVTDTNGQPVSGVMLTTDVGLSPAITDTNGNYALGFVPGSVFTVTPSFSGLMFVPASYSYTGPSTSVSNKNYLAVSAAPPVVSAQVSAGNVGLSWQGYAGIHYFVYSSTNLLDWTLAADVVPDSNGLFQFSLPVGDDPRKFFSIQTTY